MPATWGILAAELLFLELQGATEQRLGRGVLPLHQQIPAQLGQETSDFRVALAKLPAAKIQVLRQQRLGFVVPLLRGIHIRQVALGQEDDRVVLRAAPQALRRLQEQRLGLAVR